MPGGELYSLLEKRGKLTESEAKKFFFQILSAIDYSHNHGVAHRDIKPENILLDEFKNVKLGDFGLSGRMIDGEFMKTSCGSANYAAPEIVSGLKYAGTEVDIWSLGVLLYTLLAGSLPFDEASMPLLIAKIKEARYRLPYHFSHNAADLIKRMIVVNPQMRISISDMFKHPWISETYPLPPITCAISSSIDQEIFKTLLTYPQFSDLSKSCDLQSKLLSNDSPDQFSVSYSMLLHSKRKTQCSPCKKRVFKQVHLSQSLTSAPNTWSYCILLSRPLEAAISNLCLSLKSLNCFWKFLTPFHLKIINRVLPKCKRVKFEARIYTSSNKQDDKTIFIDLRLLLGCGLNFLDFCYGLARSQPLSLSAF